MLPPTRLCALSVTALLSVLGAAVSADQSTSALAETQGKELRAARITGESPKIDGRFDEEIWSIAGRIDDFVQQEPDNMSAPGERTVIQVAYDDRYLYVAARCYVRDPKSVSAGLGRRGSIPASDKIAIGLDPRHDRLTGYVFTANPSGVQSDMSLFNDTREDNDYEAVWEVGTTVTPEGWNAEFRIPFSQIRFSLPDGERSTWGFQVRRDIRQTGEWDLWNGAPRGTQGNVSRFGTLVFEDRLSPPRRVELLPFSLAKAEGNSDGGDDTYGISAGLDMRVGLGTSTTLSATVNPDFGQVELDPAVLNLSIFETFFPEKRPFFLEDSRAFQSPFGQFPMFHSRRIGATPGHFDLADNEELVSKPDQTTILAATKVSGKSNGWTYGGLGAVTAREYAVVDITTTDANGVESVRRDTRLIEPSTMYGVGRLQRDILNGTSTVAAMATSVVREKDFDAFTGGTDVNLRWHQNLYSWNSGLYASHAPVDGVPKSDVTAVTNFSYIGKRLGIDGHFDHVGKNFQNTDLGFMNSRVDKNWLYGGLRGTQADPWKFLRRSSAYFYANKQWNSDGLSINENINWYTETQLRNYWYIGYGGDVNFQFYDDLDARGGPTIVKPRRYFNNFNINTDSRKRWGIGFNTNGNHDVEGGSQRNFNVNLRLQPSGRLQTTISTGITRALDSAQWIDNTDADGDGIEDSVYGTLKRNVVNITARGIYAFSRDLTLEVYMQPFVAVGDYTDIRKLARPMSFDFIPVTIEDNPDFNRKSLRSNVVLRWEYMRGSTLYVVWNTATSDESRPGVYSPFRDLADTFGAPGNRVFVVKMNYWLSL
ncbi:MAG: carbohydrate binding family 9 domain-containing protein [Vicinamibacterales bacterium]|nr:carbohydrate binding family 9 domain-containing protein [Vicinamibacterales bacterium]